MTAIGIENLEEQIVASVIAGLIVAVLLIAGALVTRRLGSLLLRANLALAQRGLSESVRRYLAEWVAGWEHEMREAMRAESVRGLNAELGFLVRVMTLPIYLRSIQRDATRAAARDASDALSKSRSGVFHGGVRTKGWTARFEMDGAFKGVRISFSDGMDLLLTGDENQNAGRRAKALMKLANKLMDAPPAQRVEMLSSLPAGVQDAEVLVTFSPHLPLCA